MDDAADVEQRMLDLQKMRVALIILISQETSKMLSRQQRVAGKAIEVMVAERDAERDPDDPRCQAALPLVYEEDRLARDALADTEREITRMEDLMAKIDADIGAICQS